MIQTELHRHLDVSMRTSTLLELAQSRGLEAQSTSLEAFRRKIILSAPMSDLDSVLATFTLFQKVLDRPESIERAAFEAIEDCHAEGTRWVELRFSPGFVSQYNGLSYEEVLENFERGIARGLATYPGMRAGLICIASRDLGPEEADRTVEFFLKHQARFIGLDLAGPEAAFPCRLFQDAYQAAKKAGARITIHAGEGAGPENVWEAIELLGAERIGHGITSVRDPQLVKYLKDKKICLEVCPTSNWLTQAVSSVAQHPLPQLLRAGVPIAVNTDDPGVFGVTLPHELAVCESKMGLSHAEIERCLTFGQEFSFLK